MTSTLDDARQPRELIDREPDHGQYAAPARCDADNRPPPKFDELINELEAWPATGRGNGLDAAVVRRLMQRASYALHRLQTALVSPPSEAGSARIAVIEECAKVAEAQAQEFLSQQYASNQPFGSICERFACEEVAKAIRALAVTSTDRETPFVKDQAHRERIEKGGQS